jgi:flagellum-specific ATP synthase
VVVMALIGERSREISDFIDTELAGPARARTVTIAVQASDAMLCRVRGAQRAFAIAEWFRNQGRQALLILDSLSRVVHGAREVAMARGEPSGSRGYPPSALQLIADLAERAGGDRRTGGSITLVATVLAESDDRADPVVDAARGVMDGHVLLSRRLAGRGQFPAIDLVSSASRVMIDVVTDAHNRAAQRFRRMVALIEENRDLVLMGAYAAGHDAELDLALALQPVLAAFMAQDRGQATDWEDNISTLLELVWPAHRARRRPMPRCWNGCDRWWAGRAKAWPAPPCVRPAPASMRKCKILQSKSPSAATGLPPPVMRPAASWPPPAPLSTPRWPAEPNRRIHAEPAQPASRAAA